MNSVGAMDDASFHSRATYPHPTTANPSQNARLAFRPYAAASTA